MLVKFKHPVSLDGIDFKAGQQEVPDHFKKHWYFLALVNNGSAMVVGSEKKEEPVKAEKPAPSKPVANPVKEKPAAKKEAEVK